MCLDLFAGITIEGKNICQRLILVDCGLRTATTVGLPYKQFLKDRMDIPDIETDEQYADYLEQLRQMHTAAQESGSEAAWALQPLGM